MNTKKCSGCGWEFPGNWHGRTCMFCHAPILNGYCKSCGEWSEKINTKDGLCTKCRTLRHGEWRLGRINAAKITYEEWLEKISTQSLKTLTEAQWMEACRYFGGCAYCGNDQIDARSMFIPFKNGGRYCSWNIIPACEKCETSVKIEPNPFKRMDQRINRSQAHQAKKYNFSLDKLQRIVDYLQSNMEEVI